MDQVISCRGPFSKTPGILRFVEGCTAKLEVFDEESLLAKAESRGWVNFRDGRGFLCPSCRDEHIKRGLGVQ